MDVLTYKNDRFCWGFTLCRCVLNVVIVWLPYGYNASLHYETTPIQIYIEIYTPQKTENFQIKNSDIFHISAENIDYGYSLEPPRRGGSNEYPQSMFLSRNKKNKFTPVLYSLNI